MKKPKKPQENTQPEVDPVEERVREMMEPDPKPPAQPQPKNGAAGDGASTAPELSGKSIKVAFHDDSGEEDKADVVAAIEEANKQLQTKGLTEAEAEAEETEEAVQAAPEVSAAEAAASKQPKEPELSEPQPAAGDDSASPAAAEVPEPADEPMDLDSPEVEKAVDDIIAQEGDELLAAEDEKRTAVSLSQPAPVKRGVSLGGLRGRVIRRASVFVLLVGIAAAFTVPTSRYALLNTAGVRSSASLTIIDQSTQQPLKNVAVHMGGQSGQTDAEGSVTLQYLRLGPTELIIERRAFAAQKRQITVGWGSNPLGQYALQPVGTQYAFRVTDYVSGKPVVKAEVTYEDASAYSDGEGVVKLTLDTAKDERLAVSITKDGYRQEQVEVEPARSTETAVAMVPARKHTFISKRSGKYDVYKIDADGKHEELVLAGTGNEREDIVLAQHPAEELIALVSTRKGERDKDGFLLSTLNVIDLSDNSVYEVAVSERIQVIGWSGNLLVYVSIAAGTDVSDAGRNRLMSYDVDTGENTQLAAASYFNDVLAVDRYVYYAPSSAYAPDQPSSLYIIEADGSGQRTVLDKEAWSLTRSSYDQVIIALQQEWYEYQPGSDTSPKKLSGEPASMHSRIYTDSPDGSLSLWVDRRDGKGVLVAYDAEAKKDTVLLQESGLKNPVRWLDHRTLIFRIKNDKETADYVMSLDGGEPKKISDVTDTNGIDRWYYY